ncbi:MAG: hypothetical protein R3195_04380 [Gemmatimonadota bacterium]|nr:hypothetical protein [Gemmatimonadota bacterium]
MPESDRPESATEIDGLLDRLTASVERVLADYEALRARSAEMANQYASLREALAGTGGEDPGDIDERLSRLAAENRELREILLEAKERAVRLRKRLAVVEDEV